MQVLHENKTINILINMAAKLTKKQKEVVRFLIEYKNINNEYPSLQVLGNKYGITRQAMQQHLGALAKKDWIRKDDSGFVVWVRTLDGEILELSQALQSIESLRKKGTISKEEFERIKSREIERYMTTTEPTE